MLLFLGGFVVGLIIGLFAGWLFTMVRAMNQILKQWWFCSDESVDVD